ncbi:hypothetical protein KAR91_69790 [Candidatus Pacearchaeota archaeon]|nr:hypothetical protein [Candidatus Pacearchaeota archaeon]
MSKIEHATLTNVARGMAPQLFDREFKKVLENIQDTRTGAVKTRKIVMEFIIQPDQDRHALSIEVKAKSALAEGVGAKGFAFASLDGEGEPIVSLNDPKQLDLADQLKDKMGGS